MEAVYHVDGKSYPVIPSENACWIGDPSGMPPRTSVESIKKSTILDISFGADNYKLSVLTFRHPDYPLTEAAGIMYDHDVQRCALEKCRERFGPGDLVKHGDRYHFITKG